MYQQYNGYPFQVSNLGAQGANTLIRVNGIDGARAYQMMANSTVALFDSDDDVMYIKVTDGAGFSDADENMQDMLSLFIEFSKTHNADALSGCADNIYHIVSEFYRLCENDDDRQIVIDCVERISQIGAVD